MQIVTDSGMDLPPEQRAGLGYHTIPLVLTLEGVAYRSGVDIESEQFYSRLATTKAVPVASQPSPGAFAAMYSYLAQTDPEILSVHTSSGLSGALNAAREGAKLVPEARVTLFDTLTISCAAGWHIEAAARAARAGWSVSDAVSLLTRVRDATGVLFALPTLRYFVHGGYISRLKGATAAALHARLQISVDRKSGKYAESGRSLTFAKAIARIPELMKRQIPAGTPLRVQVFHANNLRGAEALRDKLDGVYACTWLPVGTIAPVLGVHTGPGQVGVVFAPLAVYPELP